MKELVQAANMRSAKNKGAKSQHKQSHDKATDPSRFTGSSLAKPVGVDEHALEARGVLQRHPNVQSVAYTAASAEFVLKSRADRLVLAQARTELQPLVLSEVVGPFEVSRC